MSERFLTVIIRDPTQDDLHEIACHPRLSALAWGHALDERDSLAWRHQRMLDQAPQPAD